MNCNTVSDKICRSVTATPSLAVGSTGKLLHDGSIVALRLVTVATQSQPEA